MLNWIAISYGWILIELNRNCNSEGVEKRDEPPPSLQQPKSRDPINDYPLKWRRIIWPTNGTVGRVGVRSVGLVGQITI